MYNKNNIDAEAEAEAMALSRQGRSRRDQRIRQETSDYNEAEFNKLFRKQNNANM
jgi:hypothetical protein